MLIALCRLVVFWLDLDCRSLDQQRICTDGFRFSFSKQSLKPRKAILPEAVLQKLRISSHFLEPAQYLNSGLVAARLVVVEVVMRDVARVRVRVKHLERKGAIEHHAKRARVVAMLRVVDQVF